MASLIRRAGGSLAIKALAAIYGGALVLLVVRVLPEKAYGQYGIAFAYVNLVAGLSRGLWSMPLVIHAAKGERDHLLGPAFWMSMSTAVAGAVIGLIILPFLHVSEELAVLVALMLLVLVPRDLTLALAQAAGRVWVAFAIEAGYFIGSLLGFLALIRFQALHTAEAVMMMNLASAMLATVIGLAFEPCVMRPGLHGNWLSLFRLGRSIGVNALCEMYLQQGDVLLMGIFFAPELVAPYAAARTLLRMYTLLSQSVNFLVLPSASRLGASNQIQLLRKRLRKVLEYLSGFLLLFNSAMWLVAPIVIPAVLGAKYEPAIPLFRLMILATFLEPVYSILANAVAGFGKPERILPILIVALSLSVVANLALLPTVGVWAAPSVLIATYAVLAFGMIRIAHKSLAEAPLAIPVQGAV